MILQQLYVDNNKQQYNIYLNKDGVIVLGEPGDADDCIYRSTILINREDWDGIKTFIDNQFNIQ